MSEMEILQVIYVKDRDIYYAFAVDENSILNIVLLDKNLDRKVIEECGVDKEVLWEELSDLTKEHLEKMIEEVDSK